jgi:hypothetical protein
VYWLDFSPKRHHLFQHHHCFSTSTCFSTTTASAPPLVSTQFAPPPSLPLRPLLIQGGEPRVKQPRQKLLRKNNPGGNSSGKIPLAYLKRTTAKTRLQMHDLKRTTAKTRLQIHDLKRTTAKTRLQIHDLKRTTAKTRLQIHDLKRTTAKTRLQIHDVKRTIPKSGLPEVVVWDKMSELGQKRGSESDCGCRTSKITSLHRAT